MAQVGRISGPLLQENLLRKGTVSPASQANLSFRNDGGTTPLLFLDVINDRLAVNNTVAGDDYKVDVTGTTQTVNLITDTANIADFTITDSTFSALGATGNIFLNAAEAVVLSTLDNGTLVINDNSITATVSNSNIDFTPYGNGQVKTFSDLNVFGNIDATGNLTLEGNITLGDASIDTVTINADLTSDVVPDQTNTYSLGSSTRSWNVLHTRTLNNLGITTSDLSVGLIDFTSRPGNVFYVSVNGSDANQGDHPLAPFATIEHALSAVDASTSGPVTIYVAPGDYQENLPLVVPNNVSIIGEGIRSVEIRPTTADQSEDVFHLNGETIIRNVTIKDFYYDSINDKGYALRYAPNAIINTRSPYVQDITVLTQETSPGAGDAGRGALIDGSELDASSNEASFLFHSCTFISPNADVINMTNGVRIEWLNSFTYFANRGLYAYNGVTGRTGPDGSTVLYGAEVRSIGSANVYGTYGTVADGADCLMYLINHNFAYIGTGTDSSNDNGLAIQENEVVELNSGQIHYISTDHTGAFRVGDSFFVDFETGETSFNVEDIEAAGFTNIIISDGSNVTAIDVTKVQTGNVRFTGNNINSLDGNLNFTPTTETNINSNVNITNNLDITGNLTFDGSINVIGDQATDTLNLNVRLEQNFNPGTDSTFNLGSLTKQWETAYLSQVDVGDIKIFDNVVTTDVSNADLELRANGTGEILVPSNNVQIDNDLTVSGDTDLQDTIITGTVTQTGDYNISKPDRVVVIPATFGQEPELFYTPSNGLGSNTFVWLERFDAIFGQNRHRIHVVYKGSEVYNSGQNTGDGSVSVGQTFAGSDGYTYQVGTFQGSGGGQFGLFDEDEADLYYSVQRLSFITELTPESSYGVPQDANFTTNALNITNILDVSSQVQFEEILFAGNVVTTTTTNADLDLRASGTGEVLVPNNDVRIETNLSANNINTYSDININLQTQFNLADISDITVTQNYITSNVTNADLELRASREVLVPNNDVSIDNNLTVSSNTDLQDLSVTGLLDQTGNRTQTGNYTISGDFSNGNITINDNFITTLNSNSDLELRASGTGEILVPNNNVQIDNNLTVSSATDLQDLSITGLLDQTGNRTQVGNYTQTGDTVINGSVNIDRITQFTDVKIDGNVIETTLADSDLDLRASGTGEVVLQENVIVDNNLSANNITSGNINIDTDLVLDDIVVTSNIIQINDNYITTTISNENLELRANGTGNLVVKSNDVRVEQDLTVNGTTDIDDVSITGLLTQTGNRIQTGNYEIVGNITVSESLTLDRGLDLSHISLDGNYIETIANNDDLDLRASGTGEILIPNNSVNVTNNLSAGSLIDVDSVSVTNDVAMEILELSTDIQFFDNVITTTNSNSNLELRANGTGDVRLQQVDFNNDTMSTRTGPLTFEVNDNVIIDADGAFKVAEGTTLERPNVQGDLRFNTDDNVFEGYNASTISFMGVYSDDRKTSVLAHPTNNTLNITVDEVAIGSVDSDGINLHGLQVDDILFDANTIATNVSNANLDLITNGTGSIVVDNITLKGNTLTNTLSDAGFQIGGTGQQWVVFEGNSAIKFPAGPPGSRPASPVLGQTRVNTDTNELETWIGTEWRTSAGEFASISEAQMDEEAFIQTLIYG
jgi:hypothetical protein